MSEANPEGTIVASNFEDFISFAQRGNRHFVDFKVEMVFETAWGISVPTVEKTFTQFELSKNINIAMKDIDRELFNVAAESLSRDLAKYIGYKFDERNRTVAFFCEKLLPHRHLGVVHDVQSPVETHLEIKSAKKRCVRDYLYSPDYSRDAVASLLN